MDQQEFRWGIIGPGRIARKFAVGLQSAPGAKLVAVASRSRERAEAFAGEFSAPRWYDRYDAIAEDPSVDGVYIATPNPMHAENSLLCLRGGKAVLCEKPFAINAAEAETVIREARSRKVFLMEAMWMRFFPLIARMRELVDDGAIGDLRMIQADFGFRGDDDPNSRLMDLALGGGALLDVGIYPVSLSSMMLGSPTEIKSLANLSPTGVDQEAAILLKHDGGRISLLSTAIRLNTPHEAHLLGTEGKIHIPESWWKPGTMTLTRNGVAETIDCPHEGNGYNYEALEVERCVRAGRIESDIMPHDETLRIMHTLDALRSQWGIKYPME